MKQWQRKRHKSSFNIFERAVCHPVHNFAPFLPSLSHKILKKNVFFSDTLGNCETSEENRILWQGTEQNHTTAPLQAHLENTVLCFQSNLFNITCVDNFRCLLSLKRCLTLRSRCQNASTPHHSFWLTWLYKKKITQIWCNDKQICSFVYLSQNHHDTTFDMFAINILWLHP